MAVCSLSYEKLCRYYPVDYEKANFQEDFKGRFSVYKDLKVFFLFNSIPFFSICYSFWSPSTCAVNWYSCLILVPALCMDLIFPNLFSPISGAYEMSTIQNFILHSLCSILSRLYTIVFLLYLKYICLINAYFLMTNDFVNALVLVYRSWDVWLTNVTKILL